MQKITDWEDIPLMFDVEYASYLLGSNKRSIQRLAKTNKIPAFKLNGKWKFCKNDIRDWLNQHKQMNKNSQL